MSPSDLKTFMKRHKLSSRDLAGILGVTNQAPEHWLSGYRGISVTTTRLIKIFDKYPQLLKEFGRG